MRFAICLSVAAVLHAAPPTADRCRDAAPEDAARLASYLVKKYRIPTTNNFHLDHDEHIDGCYHKLLFRGRGPLGDFQYTIFASPDLRFLTTDVFDSYADPQREERENAKKAMTELLAGEHAGRGPQSAPVTLVLFSDFQCPYCKKLADLMANEPLLTSGDKIRLVFRHMPLAGHNWAQQAAEAATCAAFQNKAAFWRLHDALFAHQQVIRKDTAAATVHELAAGIPGLDIKQFDTCVGQQMSLGAVIRDRDLATRLGVRGTPTLFLNGEQLHDISTGPALHHALEEALAQAQSGKDPQTSSDEPANSGTNATPR
ncbi:MAG TPA: thioredoxin domain-containing protein [Bryobacteraceae bacterium]|nr:thioredoxin domain-containing protein [Bryobacteraceae bacterium]